MEEIRAKRAEIVAKQSTFIAQLEQLDSKIAELDTNKKTPLITSVVIQESVFNHFIELQGNVSTKKMTVLSPEYPGILTKVYVKEGQTVTKDQVLAKIDDGNLSPQLAQLQLLADLAKTTYERQERLWEQKVGSEMQYLQAKTNYESQAKVVSQLQEQIEKTIIKAPFNGVVDEIITEQGNMVSPGASQIVRVVNLGEMHIETNVPERHLKSVTKDKKVEVDLPVLGETIYTTIRQVGSYINPANRTFKIEVPLSNKDNMIKPNLTVKIKINDYTNEKALLIPQSNISENAEGQQYVYVVESKKGKVGIAKRAFITTHGNYNVTHVVGSVNGSFDTIVQPIVIPPKPTAGFFYNTSNGLNIGATFNFIDTSANAVSYVWDFGDGNSSRNQNPSNTFFTKGVYNVMQDVTSAFGCTDSVIIPISINAVTEEINSLIPNAISPNGDDKNDVWKLDFLRFLDSKVTVDIFNRWGQSIFHSDGYDIPWDGTFNGNLVADGTYFYVINLNNNSEEYVFKGSILVMENAK